MSSCSITDRLRTKPSPDKFCASAAIVDPAAYEIDGPTDNSRAAFERWVNELAVKYPDLKNRYSMLLECWTFYEKPSS